MAGCFAVIMTNLFSSAFSFGVRFIFLCFAKDLKEILWDEKISASYLCCYLPYSRVLMFMRLNLLKIFPFKLCYGVNYFSALHFSSSSLIMCLQSLHCVTLKHPRTSPLFFDEVQSLTLDKGSERESTTPSGVGCVTIFLV